MLRWHWRNSIASVACRAIYYYAVVALVTTILMKNDLTKVLLECRANGTLTAEEGLAPVREEEDE